jgi:hypothetical protein
MADQNEKIEAIFRAIQDLPLRARRKLWDILKAAFPHALDDTDPTPPEIWDYPENRFGTKEVQLLRFLCQRWERREEEVLKHLWPAEWPASLKTEEILRARLRKIEQRIRERLLAFKSDWILSRPRQRYLSLTRSADWNP